MEDYIGEVGKGIIIRLIKVVGTGYLICVDTGRITAQFEGTQAPRGDECILVGGWFPWVGQSLGARYRSNMKKG